MSDLSTLRMPEHEWSEWAVACKGSTTAGYAHQNPDGTLHCNRCGWVTPEPVITTYSPDSGKVYLTWEEYVQAETNGYVVIGQSSRPGTAPVVVGPFETQEEAEKARSRYRGRWQREERRDHGPGIKITTKIRILQRP